MIRLDVLAVAIALGTTVAGVYVLSSIFFAALPQSVRWIANLFHVDVTPLFRSLGWLHVAVATILWWLIAGTIGGVAAALYNGVAR